MNLCTEPDHRRQGLARLLMQRVMDWVQQQGITVAALHASETGRLFYKQLGFAHSNEMRVRL